MYTCITQSPKTSALVGRFGGCIHDLMQHFLQASKPPLDSAPSFPSQTRYASPGSCGFHDEIHWHAQSISMLKAQVTLEQPGEKQSMLVMRRDRSLKQVKLKSIAKMLSGWKHRALKHFSPAPATLSPPGTRTLISSHTPKAFPWLFFIISTQQT